jgi:hypothetical protein
VFCPSGLPFPCRNRHDRLSRSMGVASGADLVRSAMLLGAAGSLHGGSGPRPHGHASDPDAGFFLWGAGLQVLQVFPPHDFSDGHGGVTQHDAVPGGHRYRSSAIRGTL